MPTQLADRPGGLLRRPHRTLTLSVLVMMTAFGFEGLGVATAMPTIAESLGGFDLYPWAFNSYLIASLIGTVVASELMKRTGLRRTLLLGSALFVTGAVAAGMAWSMPALLAARAAQGLGGGMTLVSMYVVVGRGYPEQLRPRGFALLGTAWAIASIIGPAIAGYLSDHVSWRAVFLAIPPALALPVLVLAVRTGALDGPRGPVLRSRLWLALVAGIGLTLIQTAGTRVAASSALVALAGLLLVGAALLRLLPSGTLRAAHGLPTAVLLRGLIGGAFVAAEAFVPLALRVSRGLTSAQAGLCLTVGAIAWAVGSQCYGLLHGRFSPPAVVRVAAIMVTSSLITMPLCVLAPVTPWIFVLPWFVGSAAVGACFAAINTLTFQISETTQQAANSSALQISDSCGTVILIALSGAVYQVVLSANTAGGFPFATIWWALGSIALTGAVLAHRVLPGRGASDRAP
ncbi:MFS transporter [Mycolicibacterium litorale]|uniref:MFS transporter n=1 Tax=Mycolicibacterium litorale TaxID=758802 RepID=UPI003CF74CB8